MSKVWLCGPNKSENGGYEIRFKTEISREEAFASFLNIVPVFSFVKYENVTEGK